MSDATSPAPAAPLPGHPAEESKFELAVAVAMLLAVITGIEIVTVYLPFAPGLLISALVVASIVKFLFVIFVFMHLRWDRFFCTILFFIGLILAGGTMWALLKVFSAANSVPLSGS